MIENKSSNRKSENSTKEPGETLAKCVFSISRVFGHWPFNARINATTQLNSIKLTACDCLWLTIILGIHLACLWFQLDQRQVESYYTSSIGANVNGWTTNIYIMSNVLNVLLSIVNRQKLLRIIYINRDFDREVRAR